MFARPIPKTHPIFFGNFLCLFWYPFTQQVPPELVRNILLSLDMNSKVEDAYIINTKRDQDVLFHSDIIQSVPLLATQCLLNC